MKLHIKLLSSFLICAVTISALVFCSISFFPAYSKAKSSKPKWKKEITSIEVGKTFHYRINNRPKKARIRFSLSHKSRASIHRKTGLFRAKKAGTVIITAKIQQKNKKAIQLKSKVKIVRKKQKTGNKNIHPDSSRKKANSLSVPNRSAILNHVTFSVAESIHPWNHSIMLYSSRILLDSEVQNSTLSLSPTILKNNAKKDIHLNAHFLSLSDDGKIVTYQLTPDSAQKMCPGNGTLDGEYSIHSNLFSYPLYTKYSERICPNSVSGYILDTHQTSLSHVSVKLYSDSKNTPMAETTTDQHGYYQFQNIAENHLTLVAERENYDSCSIRSLDPSGKNICQNIILHPSDTKNLAVACQILDEKNKPITDTAVVLTTKDNVSASGDFHCSDKNQDLLFLKGFVDSKGSILFANQKSSYSNGYTQIKHCQDQSLPKYIRGDMPKSDSVIIDPCSSLNRQNEYIIKVFPVTDGVVIPKNYQMASFSFSFSPLVSDHLIIQIHLQELPHISADMVSIGDDGITTAPSHYRYLLYDKNGHILFQTSLSPLLEGNKNNYREQLSSALREQNIRLPDGNYFAAVTAYSSKKIVLSATAIHSVKIFHNKLSAAHFQLAACRTFHSLILADCKQKQTKALSFYLYQKSDTKWFPIGIYTTSSFSDIDTKQKSYLHIPVALSDTSYLLIPSDQSYHIASGSVLLPGKNVGSAAPEHQILIVDQTKDSEASYDHTVTSELLQFSTLCPEIISFCHAYYASSDTYPNTVCAYYQLDGSFTSLLLTAPELSSIYNGASSLICDRLQNGSSIDTTQKSYSTTPFFVT